MRRICHLPPRPGARGWRPRHAIGRHHGGGTPIFVTEGARRSAGPSHDEPEADKAGGEVVEGFADVGSPLVADGKPAEAGEPGERALHHPPVPAQTLATLDP